MLPHHLTVTPNGVYKYRRRTPQELKQFIGSHEIIRSLGKSPNEAITKASDLTRVISEAIQLTQLSSVPASVITDLLGKHNLLSTLGELSITKDTKLLSYITHLFLSKSQVSPLERDNMTYVYLTLLPSALSVLFNSSDPDINTLTYDKLIKVAKLLEGIPNRNYKEYKHLALVDLMTMIHKGRLEIPEAHKMSTVTTSNHLKRIKSLLLFAQQLKVYDQALPRLLKRDKTQGTDRDYKAVLASQELSTVLKSVTDDNLNYIYKVLYYSGMRRSELYKCKVTEVEGVLCFDLRTPEVNLKTKASYRVIPVHTKLMESVAQFESIVSTIKPERMTKAFTRVIQSKLNNPDKKSLYSLRHTFATDLIAKGAHAEIVSELLGHGHNTMTMNRYVKGYPIKVLKEAVESL